MTLNHSKTWPVSTLAVVQLRVDTHGRAYSTLNESCEKQCQDFGQNVEGNGGLLPQGRLEILAKMRATIRTDTVSTILDQDTEVELEHAEKQGGFDPMLSDQHLPERILQIAKCPSVEPLELEKFHVLALTRIEEALNESNCHALGRRPSIKVDNWDFIYTETKPNRCPIHSTNSVSGPKEPELPLDARKTTTLRRHYYLEGGWGWVVVLCSVLVHVLNHGVQLAFSQLILPGAGKFKVDAVHFAVLSVIMFIGLIFSYLWTLDDLEFFETLIFLGTTSFLCIGSLPFLFIFPSRVSKFLLTFQILDKVDETIKNMGIEISYKVVYYGSLWTFMNQLTAFVSVVCHHFQGRPWKMQVGGHLGFGIAARVSLHSMNYCIVIYYAIYQRFLLLNDYLKSFHRSDYSDDFVKEQLCLVADLHQKLCESANGFLESLDLSCFIIYLENLIFVEIAIFYGFRIVYKSGFGVEVYVYSSVSTAAVFMFIFALEMVKRAAEETKHVLVEYIVYRSKTSIQTSKRNFLLQLLHQKINNNLCGLLEAKFSKLLEDFGFVIAIAVYIMQLQMFTENLKL